MTPRVVVIGGGLTGLATAWRLREVAEVAVFEAGGRLGGQVRTIEFGGTSFDVGADALLARQPDGERLVRDLGLGDELVASAAARVALWCGGRLRPLPAGTVFGVPSDLRELARSRVLSSAGLARALAEPLLPRRFVPGDRSVGDLVGERFGREVAETLVEPLLGGVYAGRVEDLSAQATVAPVWAAAREHRSLVRGLAARRAAAAAGGGPVFLTVRGGLSRVVQQLTRDLGSRVHRDAAATGLERVEYVPGGRGPSRHGWRVVVDGRAMPADHVVLALPAAPAAMLLGPVVPAAARELAGIRTASVGVVALAYHPDDARTVPEFSGVLVPRSVGRTIKAVTISSRKWPHLASEERFLVRASVGRVDDRAPLELDDSTLAERVDTEVRSALGLRAPARERHVVRWEDALPQYDVGHLQRVDRLRHALSAADVEGLHVAGASLDGVGLSARAREAARLATRITEHVDADGGRRDAPVRGR